MQLLFLALVFLTIVVLLALRRPLWQAISSGILMSAILFRLSPLTLVQQTANVVLEWSSCTVLLSLYLITYLQRMLEARQQLKLAQQDLNGLFHNRRINAGGAPVFIGLLPSAAAMILCGDIVKESTEGYLEPKEQAFITSWFRHIPESTLPTYTGVLLITSISGVSLPKFMLGMIVPMITLCLIGYIPYLRKLPRDPGTPPSQNRLKDAVNLVRHLWTLLLILLLIIVGRLSVVFSVLLVIVAAAFFYRFSLKDLAKMLRSAFEPRLIGSTFLVLLLKNCFNASGVLDVLSDALSQLPIPTYLVFALLFFLGAVISGFSGFIAIGAPLAFAVMPASVPLVILLVCMGHAASQICPIHVCLVVAAEYYHVTIGELIRKTIPCSLLFCALMLGYHQLLLLLPW